VWWLTPARVADCVAVDDVCVASFAGNGRTGETVAAFRFGKGAAQRSAAFVGMPGTAAVSPAADGLQFGLSPDYSCSRSLTPASCLGDAECVGNDICAGDNVANNIRGICVPNGCSNALLKAVDAVIPTNIGLADDSGLPFGGVGAGRVPDIDGDGVDDIAFSAAGNGALGVFVFTDATLFVAGVSPAPALEWPNPSVTNFGRAIVDAGDLDGDGRHDLAIGSDNGVFVAFASNYATLQAVARPNDFDDADEFGHALAPFGARNGGDVHGLAIGAPNLNDGAGAVMWLFSDELTPPIGTSCRTAGTAASRLGSALRALGPSPAVRARARVAAGAPGVHTAVGSVAVLDVVSGGADCVVEPARQIDGVTAGDRFGASLGQ